MRNLYEVLGVARDADQATIRKSFKKLARENHPDLKQDDPAATERFKEISAAYEVLGDEEKRSLYDEFGEVSLKPGFDADRARQYRQMGGGLGGGLGGGGFGFGGESVSFEDLFGNLFRGGAAGGRRAPPRATRGADIESPLRVSLLDAVRGGSETLSVRRPTRCATCSGEGGTGRQTCASCGGMGRIRMSQGGFFNAMVPCDACGGSGATFTDECHDCGGTGRTMTEERLKIRIPPGVTDGQVIRLRGKGGEGRGDGPAGDLLLQVEVAEHPFLRREGADLLLDVPITISEAMAGGRVEVPTPDGNIRVTIPVGAASGQRLRLRGKGAPGSDGARGDLYLVLRPTPPTASSEEALEAAAALDAFYDRDVRADLKL